MDAEAHVRGVVGRWLDHAQKVPEADRRRVIGTAEAVTSEVIGTLIAAGHLTVARGAELMREAMFRFDPSGAEQRFVSGFASAQGTGRVVRGPTERDDGESESD